MAKREYSENGVVSKGEVAAHCFEREVAKTAFDNVNFPYEQPEMESSRYNPYKKAMNK